MKPILTLVKNPETDDRNYFGFDKIHIYAFNFDGEGGALVSHDNEPGFSSYHGRDLHNLLCGHAVDGTRLYLPEPGLNEATFCFPAAPGIQ
ncbi:MAG TPA: hypothetical protein PLU47_14355 [Azonexus sp.]|nr:hypothetical protein [Azonexus sp.]